MKNIKIEFLGNDVSCTADVQLDGIADAWHARAKITGHPTIDELHITYRLGDFLTPMFISESERQLFSLLLKQIAEQAEILLPKEYAESIESD